MALGDAYIDVHANTKPFARELDDSIPIIAGAGEKDFDKVGKEWGETLADSTSKELKRHGKDLAEAVESATKGKIIKTRWGFRNVETGRFAKGIADDMAEEVSRAFGDAGKRGGPLSKIGRGIADAIGAGFNVSGRSPLIAVLVPVIGFIVELVLGAIQAVQALGAVLATIPALLAAIGFQVGVLFIAFDGLGKAVQGAFAAKNAKELKEALEGLTPSAQDFVRSLLPLKGFFDKLKKSVQEFFFSALGDIVGPIRKALEKPLLIGLGLIASALGQFFRGLGLFFASPSFVKFVNTVLPATTQFLTAFGPSFVTFLKGIVDIAVAAMPFLNRMGRGLGRFLENVGIALSDIAKDPAFQAWLDRMFVTLGLVMDVFRAFLGFIFTLMDTLDKAGGNKVLENLILNFDRLSFFLTSPVGLKAMEGVIHLVEFLTNAFFALLLLVLLVIAGFEKLGELITYWFSPAGFKRLGETLMNFFTGLGRMLQSFFGSIGSAIRAAVDGMILWVLSKIASAKIWIEQRWNDLVNFFRLIPGRIIAALGDFGTLLFDSGIKLMQGLIRGIRYMFDSLRRAISDAAGIVTQYWPFSPAKEGPLSGKGDPLEMGRRVITRLAEGIRMEADLLRTVSVEATSNIIIGAGAVRMSFEGALPTEQQAMTTGRAAGEGLARQLAVRNTRLAVRSL